MKLQIALAITRMKPSASIAALLICMSTRAWGQPKEVYQPKIIIQGTWGTAPGQYGRGLVSSNQKYADTFAVDENENIYVLDELNNRVQHYDSNGNLLNIISLACSGSPTKEQTKKAPLLEQGMGIGHFGFIGDTLYAVQEFYFLGAHGRPLNKVLKLQSNRFVNVESSTESASALYRMSYEWQQRNIRTLLTHDANFHLNRKKVGSPQGIKTLEEPAYNGITVLDVFIDQDKNRWIIGGTKNWKYSPSGVLLSELDTPNIPVISNHGNYYVLNLYPAAGTTANDAFTAQGISISKYSLK